MMYERMQLHDTMVVDGQRIIDELMATAGAMRTMLALLASGPSYVKALSYDIRLPDKTIRKALQKLLSYRLVQEARPDIRAVHAKEYYELTPVGIEIATMVDTCNEKIGIILSKHLKKSN